MTNVKSINIIQDLKELSAIEARTFRLYPIFLIDPSILPLANVDKISIKNKNNFREVVATSPIGLPYGSDCRLIIAYLTTIAKHTNKLTAPSLRSIAQECGMTSFSGGKNGSIPRFAEQLKKVLALDFYINEQSKKTKYMIVENIDRAVIADKIIFEKTARTKINISFKLSESYCQLSQTRGVFPVDNRALIFLKHNRNVLSIDLYLYLAYKAPNMRKHSILLRWELLQNIFSNAAYKRIDNFKILFKKALILVKSIYLELNAYTCNDGLVINKSPSHVPRLNNKVIHNDS